MAALKALVRYFSYLFGALLALFLLAISGLALASGTRNLQLGMLPWTGSTLIYVVFFSSLYGLISVVLAIRGSWRPLFFLWTLAVAALLVRGYIFTGYHFATGEAARASYLMLASVIGVIGAWWAMFPSDKRRRRY